MIQKNWQALIKPDKLVIESGEDPERFAVVVAEPLERGFGLTLGNTLRRVLLSSLQGAAVTSIQIDGVLHEFSSVPGVREDVTDIVLNVKAISVRMHGEGPKRMTLRGQGPGEMTAGMIDNRPRHRDSQPRSGDLHPRRRRQPVHRDDGRIWQGLRRGGRQSARGRADRPDSGRRPVWAGQESRLQGRGHARGPDSRLRQADHAGRDQRHGNA